MIRCSSIAQIMTKPKSKNDLFSATAKSAMMDIVRAKIFGVQKSLDNVKCIKKGKMLEDDGIDLYNKVFLTDFEKCPPESRRNNGIITGEPDLVAKSGRKGVDIKVSWSLLTFPLTSEQAEKKEYEWQARGYMCLFDVDVWEIAYCALDTPDELLSDFDDRGPHKISSEIPDHNRITVCRYERDKDLEREMLDKCGQANNWIKKAVIDFYNEHDKYIK